MCAHASPRTRLELDRPREVRYMIYKSMCRTPRRVQRGPRTPRLSGAGSSVSLEGVSRRTCTPRRADPRASDALRLSAYSPPGPHHAWPRAAAKAGAAAARTCATSCRIRTGAWRRAAGQAPPPRPAGRLNGPSCTTIQLNCTTVQLNCTTPTPQGRDRPTGRQVCRPLPWERGTS